jgi:hypothetical protein
MIKIEHEITLQDHIDEVFTFIANSENNPKWDPDCLEAEITSEGPIGVGTTGKYIQNLLGTSYYSTFRVDEYEPPFLVTKHITSDQLRMEIKNGLVDVGNGTRLTQRLEIRHRGPKKLLELFMAKRIEKQIMVNLDKLKLYFRIKSAAGL